MVVHGLEGPVPDGPSARSARLTVVASRRVGNAVQRNRAKRLLREAARCQPWREDVDVVLVARAACVDSGLADVSDELRSHGLRLELFEAGT